MKEKRLIEIGEWLNTQGFGLDLSDSFWMEDCRFGEHKVRDIAELLDDFCNQEVEKRIAKVLPTKNEIGNACQLFDKQKRPLWKEAIWRAGANWAVDIIRSRLTQKTEGGGE